MSTRSDSSPWNDIETVLDAVRVEEEAHLAVLEALGVLDDPEVDEFSWDDFPLGECLWDDFPLGECLWDDFLLGERPWGDLPMNAIHR